MTQTKVEKKFFRVRVAQFRQNLAAIIDQKLSVAEFQPLNPILFVKRDTIPVSSSNAVRRGGSDA